MNRVTTFFPDHKRSFQWTLYCYWNQTNLTSQSIFSGRRLNCFIYAMLYGLACITKVSTYIKYTEIYLYTSKNAQVVTNLHQTCSNAVPTTCQQDTFVLLVPSLLTSCQRLVDNLLQGCWVQQTCYKLFQQLVIVLQLNNLSTSCEWQACSNSIK
jgi:hypothetical protein